MSNDLSELLRSVIREELAPVNEQLERMESDQLEMKDNQKVLLDNQKVLIEEQELIKRAVLETNERLINVESILENQHRIIELLSA
ncbi:hypothetical protein D3C81_649500 [compost metagenome]